MKADGGLIRAHRTKPNNVQPVAPVGAGSTTRQRLTAPWLLRIAVMGVLVVATGAPAHADVSPAAKRRFVEERLQWALRGGTPTPSVSAAEMGRRVRGSDAWVIASPLLDGTNDPSAGEAFVVPADRVARPANGSPTQATEAAELRFLAEFPSTPQGEIAYVLGSPSPEALARGLRTSSDAFFTWLALRPSTFWVNLQPGERDRIIDSEMGRTDAGRIMLEADLQMKKTVARLIHPDDPGGQAFWEGFSGASGGCLSFRQWIVPGKIRVFANRDAMYIADASLDVKLDSHYRNIREGGDAPCSADPAAEAHFRQAVLPQVVAAVNRDSEYAALRTVFAARIAAEWYRTMHRDHARAFGSIIDTGKAEKWYSTEAWAPEEVHDRYVRSLQEPEISVERRIRTETHVGTARYIYGGVDFVQLPMNVSSFAELRLIRNEERSVAPVDSFAAAMTDAIVHARGFRDLDGDTFGGATFLTVVAPPPTPPPPPPPPPPSRPTSFPFLPVLGGAAGATVAAMAALSWWRWRTPPAGGGIPAAGPSSSGLPEPGDWDHP